MALVSTNRDKNNPLDRGPAFKPQNEVALEDITTTNVSRASKNIANMESDKSGLKSTTKRSSVPGYAAIRIDRNIRNKVEALVSIGVGKTQKEIVELGIATILENYLKPEEVRAYSTFLDMFERTDKRRANE